MTITNLLRYSVEGVKGDSLLVTGDELGQLKDKIVQSILLYTKPYFTKPLKQDDVERKLKLQSNPPFAPDDETTKYTLNWNSLHISNSMFLCEFGIEAKEKILTPVIEFVEEVQDDEIEDIELDSLPFSNEGPISVQDARDSEKERVKAARLRAARYLLRSEQLYKKYVEKWGEPESDWDSSDDESMDDSDSEE